MKKEFVTVRGKVFIENDLLTISNKKLKENKDMYWMGFNAIFAMHIIDKDSKAKPLAYAILGILAFLIIIALIEFFFINSWKNKIPLSSIQSVKVEDDRIGLETLVILKLRSGKRKEITFRTLENQFEPFVDLVSQYIMQKQYT